MFCYINHRQVTAFTKVLVTKLLSVSKAEEITVEDSKHSKTINYICHVFAVVAQKPVKPRYRAALHFAVCQSIIKYTARGQGWHYRLCKPDPCLHRPQPLSLTSGALRPLSLQHLISPLNLRLTRSFSSKGLPLCLQPSSTNGAWKGIEERWRVAVSVVVRRSHQPRGEKKSRVRSVRLPEACGTKGHPGCSNVVVQVYVVGWECLFIPTGLLTLSCGSDRLF